MAPVTSPSRTTTVMFCREPPWETITRGRPSRAPSTRVARLASRRRPSPTAQTMAIPSSLETSANSDRSVAIASRALRSSMVTDTLTSEVVTTSTGVR